MNYNVKRLSNPLKGRCTHNQEILDTIDIVTDDSPGLCPFNKGYLLRRLGQAMETIDVGCFCNRPIKLISLSPKINGSTGEPFISYYSDEYISKRGFLLVIRAADKSLECIYLFDGPKGDIITLSQVNAPSIYKAFSYPLKNEFIEQLKNYDIGERSMDYDELTARTGYNASYQYLLYTH